LMMYDIDDMNRVNFYCGCKRIYASLLVVWAMILFFLVRSVVLFEHSGSDLLLLLGAAITPPVAVYYIVFVWVPWIIAGFTRHCS
jgi:hypothetical protein